MDCAEVQKLLSEYIDGTLNNSLNGKIKKHIDACDTCRKEYELLSKIISECNNICDEDLPDGFHEKLFSTISERAAADRRNERFDWVRKCCRTAPALIAIVFALVTAAGFGMVELIGYGSKKATTASCSLSMNSGAGSNRSVNAEQDTNITDNVIAISLSSDEYKKDGSSIDATVKSYGGRIAIEPYVYMMPVGYMDTIVKQLQDKLGPNKIKVSNLESEVQHQSEYKNSTSSEDKIWGAKNNELNVLNNNSGYIIIEINVTD